MKAACIQRVLLLSFAPSPGWRLMNVFELTRALVDIESITNNEERVGHYLCGLSRAARRALRCLHRTGRSGAAPLQRVRAVGPAANRHAFHPHGYRASLLRLARDDGENIWGRASCDTKGIIASMIKAIEALLEAGDRNFGLLFVWRRSATAPAPTARPVTPRGSRTS